MTGYCSSIGRPALACIAGCSLVRLAGSATGLMVGVYLAQVSATNHPISPAIVGLVMAAHFAAELLSAPAFGAWADRLGPRPLLLLGPLLGLAATQILSLTALLPLVLVARMIEGLSAGSSAPAALSYLSTTAGESEARRGRTMSLLDVGTLVGIIGGLSLAGPLWAVLHTHAFQALGIVYLGSVLLFLLVPRAAVAPTARRAPLLKVMLQPSILRFIPTWVVLNACAGVWVAHTTFQLSGGNARPGQYLTLGFSSQQVSAIFTGYFTLIVLGTWLWGFAFSRLRSIDIMLASLAGVLLTCPAIYAINHGDLSPGPGLLLWLVVLVLGILLESGSGPAALTYLAGVAVGYSGGRGQIMGLYSVFFGLGQALGALLGGVATARAGIDGMVVLTAALAAIALYAVNRLRSSRGGTPQPLGAPA